MLYRYGWDSDRSGAVLCFEAREKGQKAVSRSEAEILMWEHLKELQPSFPVNIYREFAFHPERKWRFDFAIIPHKDLQGSGGIAIEIDGGSWVQGRHNTGSGSAKDRQKFNEAARLKWTVLKFTPREVNRGLAIDYIRKVLES